MKFNRLLLIKNSCFSLLILSISSSIYAAGLPIAPEASGLTNDKPLVTAVHSMIVTNNPWSTKSAKEILAKGGNATDAAIAAAFVLGLTEPQSSGIGGGGYALSYNAKDKQLTAFDGRETAPQSATAQWFLDQDGKPLNFESAMLSARSVGIPSEIALLYKMHQLHGKLSWDKLLQPAIKLAQNGFPLSQRLHDLLIGDQADLNTNPQITQIYFDHDTVKKIGTIIKNPEYAASLKIIAKDPVQFYNGAIAKNIVKTINTHAKQPLYTLSDLSNYQVIIHNPVCSDYRGKYKICSVPPSTSGGVTVEELLNIYARNYNGSNPLDINWVYNFLEASKLAYADRNQYLADPNFVTQPIAGLLESSYLDRRAQLVNQDKPLLTPVEAGIPKDRDPRYGPDISPKAHGTTSISVVDKDGNAVSMTVTIEHQFGSHLFTNGFFLNNELTDFSFTPYTKSGQLVANRVEAGKRPRSSIAPVMVFDKSGNLQVITGSPGGSQIICYVAKNLIQILDFKQNAKQAVSTGNLCAVNNTPQIETGSDLTKFITDLGQKGESVIPTELVSGETNILRTKNGWSGSADPRREGIALGN